MTCIVKAKSKKQFKEDCKTKPDNVRIEDPSIFSPRTFFASQIKEGETIYVTNHPKRSWFANVTRKSGKLVIK